MTVTKWFVTAQVEVTVTKSDAPVNDDFKRDVLGDRDRPVNGSKSTRRVASDGTLRVPFSFLF